MKLETWADLDKRISEVTDKNGDFFPVLESALARVHFTSEQERQIQERASFGFANYKTAYVAYRHSLYDSLDKFVQNIRFIPHKLSDPRYEHVSFATIAGNEAIYSNIAVMLNKSGHEEKELLLSEYFTKNTDNKSPEYVLNYICNDLLPSMTEFLKKNLDFEEAEFDNKLNTVRQALTKDPKNMKYFQGIEIFGPIDQKVWRSLGADTSVDNTPNPTQK